jgi:hypothetical protein
MIVNGSFNPGGGLPPGKVWCQTIDRVGGANVGYYVFSVWVQNMISGDRTLDVPQLRMSICDMEAPNSPGTFPLPGGGLANTVLAAGSGGNGMVSGKRLPGVTYASQTPVLHVPAPPVNRLKAPRVDFPYGAAMYCNIPSGFPGAEALDTRLKVLGASFLVNERPDQWTLVRCIYRAPRDVTEFNACI